ncbi:predicted protein, partial [Nematostella vectensis]
VKDQQEAEKKKVTSMEIQTTIEKQTKQIKEKQQAVMKDLAQVEPAVDEARQAVKGIKKQHLVELRTMGNPPATVKLALESICLLLGEQAADWKQIRAIIIKDNFIPTIVNFSTEDISFLDDAFRKNLESALRFGNPLLVQDVESYDPILNPVLNRELRRTGGRVLISLGDQDIDLSPSFTIFLSTRDPTIEFPPDLCSRVTFVNFTVTRSSLQSQCLNQVLKAERPDVDEKRSDLLKLQGEFHLRLRHLEKSLLQALNEAKGKILDDDRIIATLEKLKKEAAEITRKVEETDVIMAEVETVSEQYRALSHYCSSLYFTMEALNMVHFLYQYSLQFFLDIFQCVLYENPHLQNIRDPASRLKVLTSDLFQVKASTPVLMCSVTGYDASGWVEDLAAQENTPLTSIAIAPIGIAVYQLLVIQALRPDRIIAMLHKVVAVILGGDFMHAAEQGLDLHSVVEKEVKASTPVLMCSVTGYDASGWVEDLAAQENTPLTSIAIGSAEGFSDAEKAINSAVKSGRWVMLKNVHLAPQWLVTLEKKLHTLSPHASFRLFLTMEINPKRLLSTFVNRLFTVSSFESDFALVTDVDGKKGKNISMPEGIRREQFVQWVEHLPDAQTPSWLGLPNNAEKLLLTQRGQDLIAKLLKMQLLGDDDELAYSPDATRPSDLFVVPTSLTKGMLDEQKRRESDPRPAWMRTLHTTAANWLTMIPKSLTGLKRTLDNIKDPLFRYFEREVNTGIQLLNTVHQDLSDTVLVCEAQKKPTNYLRGLMSDLAKGFYIRRLNLSIWLGGMFVPEAYITATRQFVAQANNWSLEELALEVTVANSASDKLKMDDCSFGVTGLKLQGASCYNNQLELTTTISTDLPLTSLKWIRLLSSSDKPQSTM